MDFLRLRRWNEGCELFAVLRVSAGGLAHSVVDVFGSDADTHQPGGNAAEDREPLQEF